MNTIWNFIKSTKWVSRILFGLWIYAVFFSPFARSQPPTSNYLIGVAIYCVIILGPVFGIEVCKNPVIKQFRKKNTNNSQENDSKSEEKYNSKSRIVAILCFVLFVSCVILNGEEKMKGMFFGYLSPFFGILALVFFGISTTAPKTKSEAAKRKIAKQEFAAKRKIAKQKSAAERKAAKQALKEKNAGRKNMSEECARIEEFIFRNNKFTN